MGMDDTQQSVSDQTVSEITALDTEIADVRAKTTLDNDDGTVNNGCPHADIFQLHNTTNYRAQVGLPLN